MTGVQTCALPISLTTNQLLDIGIAIDTTAITIDSQDASVAFGQNYTLTFTFHRSNDIGVPYEVEDVDVSNNFSSDFWTEGVDYNWYDAGGGLTGLDLFSGFGTQLNDTGVIEVYIHVKNSTVETTVEKLFVVVEPVATDIAVLVDGVNITAEGSAEVNFTASFTVDIYYYTTVPLANITGTATVEMTNGTTDWILTPVGNGYQITLDTDALGALTKYSFTVTCNNQSTQTQLFKFTIFPRALATELIVNSTAYPSLQPADIVSVNWSDTIDFYLTYRDLVNDQIIQENGSVSSEVYALIGTNRYDATSVNTTTWLFSVDTANLPLLVGGSTLITFRATNPTYELSEFIINLYTAPIELKASYLINGLAEENATNIFVGETMNVTVNVTTWDDIPVSNAAVTLSYDNDTNPTQSNLQVNASSSGNLYTCILPLDTDTFWARFQFFNLRIAKENHTNIVEDVSISLNPLLVIANSTNAIGQKIGQKINLRITLVENATGLPFTQEINDIQIFVRSGYHAYTEMTNLGNGTFIIELSPVYEATTFSITVNIEVPSTLTRTYGFETDVSIGVSVSEQTGGIDPWVVWVLMGALIFVVAWFIAYQVRFKYPPMIRKIQDLRRKVARGKDARGIKEQKVRTREENIFNTYADSLNKYSFLQTRDSRYAAKSSGYAPVPDESISLEFDMVSMEPPEETMAQAKPIGPKTLTPDLKAKRKKAPEMPKAPAMEKPAIKAPSAVVAPSKPSQPAVKQVRRTLPKLKQPPVPAKPVTKAPPPKLEKPVVSAPKKAAPSPVPRAQVLKRKQEPVENLYQKLVLLEQKRYKAERSIRDLNAKHARGSITDEEYKSYEGKLNERLEKLKEQIAELRRKMITF